MSDQLERDALRKRVAELEGYVAATLPYLEEAWVACFDGQEKALLSAEQRGMGRLLGAFRKIAAGKPALPPGVITIKDANDRVESATQWAHRLLGQPNAMHKHLQRWVQLGETCADGLARADTRIAELERRLAMATRFDGEGWTLWRGFDGKWILDTHKTDVMHDHDSLDAAFAAAEEGGSDA